MDAILKWLKNPLVAGVVGLIVGLSLGLIFAWGIWPVEWKDAPPELLRYDVKVDYLRAAIDAYGKNGNIETAKARYESLGADKDKALAEIHQQPDTLDLGTVETFMSAVSVPVVQTTPGAEGTPVVTETKPVAKPSFLSKYGWPLLLCGVVLLAALVVFYMVVLRGKGGGGAPTPAQQAEQARRDAVYTDYTTEGGEQPIAQFMASYKLGDDLFDDSFSIDSAAGEFLGECGVGISDTIGVGDPKKVTAFEVWLFDKNDIQTVTKVIMSTHAFEDTPTRQRLEAKGEPIQSAPGGETVLETQTLQLVARVVDMSYGEGAMPAQSYFDHFILELSIWQKPQ